MSLNDIQYDSVMRLFSRRRNDNKALLEHRRAQIYSEIPEYSEVEDQIAEVSINAARSRLGMQNASLQSQISDDSDLDEIISSLNDLKRKCLVDHGYSPDYLDDIYSCRKCQDTGYVNGHKCICFKKVVTDMMFEQSGLSPVISRENFDSLSYDYYSPSYRDPSTDETALQLFSKAVDTSREFVRDFDRNFTNLLFYGDTGVGKTFLSNCIAGEMLKSGHSVVYMTAGEFFDAMAALRFDKESKSMVTADYIMDSDLLIIDDLGTELSNSFTSSEFFNCVNERLIRQRPTIISTNLSINEIKEAYSERVFSRILSNYVMLKLVGDDIRVIKKQTRNS